MPKARSRFLTCQDRNIHFLEWGNEDRETVIIWHGVTGTAQDHGELATRLAENYHVICPDSIGCGLSDWTHDKKQDPGLTFYAQIARDLLAQLGPKSIRWIGASKGGGLGIILAHIMTECPITHLVLNDVGPGFPDWLRQAAMINISEPHHFKTFPDFKAHLRDMFAKGGLMLEDKEWDHLARNWSRRTDEGHFTFQNDPALANQFSLHAGDFNLWDHYEKITAPTLLIRGAGKSIVSDFETEKMQITGPKCALYNRPGGHVSLMQDRAEQDVIIEFLQD